jgi:hypothetical protein
MLHSGTVCVFRLAMPPTEARIVSRSGAPQELGTARDPRCLGVALRQIRTTQGVRMRVIDAGDVRLAVGFHGFERDIGVRWTSGDACLPAALFDGFNGPVDVTLHLGGAARYVDDGSDAVRVA